MSQRAATPDAITPCLWMADQAEEAAAFYIATFPGGRVVATSRYPENVDNPSRRPRGSVLTVEFEIAGKRFTALNGGPLFKVNPSISFFVFVDTPAEVDRLYGALIVGGQARMPLDRYPWSERYGWVEDRFGVSWQIMLTAPPVEATIVPCLMFSGPVHGRAAEAMQAYTEIFPHSKILTTARYEPGEGPEGTVKHGRFSLEGQVMVAMDSHVTHDVTFNEGLSLQVSCADQREVDHYWDRLSQGGKPSACGWLKDRFGVSWQVVPSNIAALMTNPDAAARERTFNAIMKMTKPDIAALERAAKG